MADAQEEVLDASYDLFPVDMRYAILTHKGGARDVTERNVAARSALRVAEARLADAPPRPAGAPPADGTALADVTEEVCAQLRGVLETAGDFQHHYARVRALSIHCVARNIHCGSPKSTAEPLTSTAEPLTSTAEPLNEPQSP
eukprot:1183996-Prorocentrum_minimum.AAC.2